MTRSRSSRLADVAADAGDVRADAGDGLVQRALAAAGDEDVRAFGGEAAGGGQADARGAAGDEGGLAVELSHDGSPLGLVFQKRGRRWADRCRPGPGRPRRSRGGPGCAVGGETDEHPDAVPGGLADLGPGCAAQLHAPEPGRASGRSRVHGDTLQQFCTGGTKRPSTAVRSANFCTDRFRLAVETGGERGAGVTQSGRPRGFDTDEALERAVEVFWRQGYEGASVNDLTEAMGINKPSLYAAFGSKEELFRKAVARYAEKDMGYARDAFAQPTAYEVVATLLRENAVAVTRTDRPAGCLSIQGGTGCSTENAAIAGFLASQPPGRRRSPRRPVRPRRRRRRPTRARRPGRARPLRHDRHRGAGGACRRRSQPGRPATGRGDRARRFRRRVRGAPARAGHRPV